MKIYINELDETPTVLHFSETDAWVSEAVHSTQEAELENKKPKYSFDVELRKLQEVVFLKGKVLLEMGVLCSRCANTMELDLASNFQAMFTRDKTMGNDSERG